MDELVKKQSKILEIKTHYFYDERGTLEKIYDNENLIYRDINIKQVIITTNSKKGIIRGFHFQFPIVNQKKILKCIKGEIFVVLLDIDKQSSNFGKYYSVNLDDKAGKVIHVLPNFALGYQVIKKSSKLLYLITDVYKPEQEFVINPLDKELGVRWPIKKSTISQKDKNSPSFKNYADL